MDSRAYNIARGLPLRFSSKRNPVFIKGDLRCRSHMVTSLPGVESRADNIARGYPMVQFDKRYPVPGAAPFLKRAPRYIGWIAALQYRAGAPSKVQFDKESGLHQRRSQVSLP